MMEDEKQAARLLIEFRAKIIGIPEIVEWADGRILATERPIYELIELSTLQPGDTDSAMRLLRKVSETISHFDALRLSLPSIRRGITEGLLSPYDAAFFIHRYCDEAGFANIPEDLISLWSYAENYSAAREGTWGVEADLDDELKAELKEYIQGV